MKAVQIGILVALVVVAGLLFKVYQSQTTQQPAAAAAVTEPAAAPAPAAVTLPAAPVETAASPPVVEPERPKPAVRKRPSPAPRLRREPETVAQSRPPESLAQPPQAPAPAAERPARAAEPAAEQPPSALPPPPRVPLSPPSGTGAATEPAPAPRVPAKVTVPAGTVLSVRLSEPLSSEKNHPGDTFSATLDQPLVVDGFELAARGARVQGRVLELEESGRIRGLAAITIHLVRLHTADGQDVTIQTDPFTKRAESTRAEDAKKIGVGAAIGAAIGAIAGGGKGAAIGAGIGGAAGAGTVAATRGQPAVIRVETHLTFRTQAPVTLTEMLK